MAGPEPVPRRSCGRPGTSPVQAGKLAVLGQMSAGISHEINQPLTALHTLTDNAAALLERGRLEEVRENLGLIGQMADRMEHIVREIKTFSRRASSGLRSAPVDAVLDQALMLVDPRRRQLDATIQVAQVPEGLAVLVDPLRLEQVLVNLLSNALDATAGRPVRRILLEAADTPDGVRIQGPKDSGPGLPPAVMDRLFEPFFTTKPVGQGLGLGLAISRIIVDELGGAWRPGNAEGGAARFVPAAAESDGCRTWTEREPPLAVFLVEDDGVVLRGCEQAMRLADFEVQGFRHAEGALAAMEETPPAVVVSDVRVPGVPAWSCWKNCATGIRTCPSS